MTWLEIPQASVLVGQAGAGAYIRIFAMGDSLEVSISVPNPKGTRLKTVRFAASLSDLERLVRAFSPVMSHIGPPDPLSGLSEPCSGAPSNGTSPSAILPREGEPPSYST